MGRKVLVTGAGGQLGRELVERGAARGSTMVGLTRAELDIADAAMVQRTLRALDVDLVVNAAAHTAVDLAEGEPDTAFAINAEGAGHLAVACAQRSLLLVHISTDYVFDGSKTAGYLEDDPVQPINVYGASKEAGERAVRAALPMHVILRTSWVYSSHGRNFVRTMLQLAAERDEMKVVADQYGCPTSAGDLAEAVFTIAEQLDDRPDRHGTYHFAGGGHTTWYGFAQAVMELCRPAPSATPRLVPIPTRDFPRPARRPTHSILDCGRVARTFDIVPRPWREALADVGRELQAAG